MTYYQHLEIVPLLFKYIFVDMQNKYIDDFYKIYQKRVFNTVRFYESSLRIQN